MSLTLLFNFFLSFSEKIIWIWDIFQKCLLVLTDQNTSAVPASWGVPEPNTSLPGLLCETPETSMHEPEVSLWTGIFYLYLFVCLYHSPETSLPIPGQARGPLKVTNELEFQVESRL